MKKRKTLRNIIAVLILLVVLGGAYLLLTGGFTKFSDLSSKPIILELDLDKPIVEDSSDSPFAQLGFDDKTTLQDTLAGLEAARKDNRVKALIVTLGTGSMGVAQLQDMREAILRFRQAGKKAYAFAETFGEFSGGNGSYYLASAFDKIYLQPSGDVGLTGLIGEPMFLRGTLEKLEIVPRGSQRYEYKNALDTFTEKQMTPAFREAITVLLQSIQNQIIAGIAEGRKKTPQEVMALINDGPHLGNQAVQLGLADELKYRDEVYETVKDEVKDARLLYLSAYLKKSDNPYGKGKPIALVYGVGGVQRGESEQNPFTDENVMGSDTVTKAIRSAADNDDVKVILFRVDCPGGSYVASDAILRELAQARKNGKKIVVSMGNVAASGGYIVALAADRVIAQPGTITGSIGVLAFKLLTRDFWAHKLGITFDGVALAENATMWSSLHDYNPEQWAKFNAWLDRIYQEFTDKVAAGRNLPKEKVLEIAKGRVWSGEDAKARGLVDELGSFQRAVEVAKELSGISPDAPAKLLRYPRPKSLFEILTSEKGENSEEAAMVRALVKAIAPLRPALKALREINASPAENVVAMPDPNLSK